MIVKNDIINIKNVLLIVKGDILHMTYNYIIICKTYMII